MTYIKSISGQNLRWRVCGQFSTKSTAISLPNGCPGCKSEKIYYQKISTFNPRPGIWGICEKCNGFWRMETPTLLFFPNFPRFADLSLLDKSAIRDDVFGIRIRINEDGSREFLNMEFSEKK